MVVVTPLMYRHRMRTFEIARESFQRVCMCGWASGAYKPNTQGRATAAADAEKHLANAELLHIRWVLL